MKEPQTNGAAWCGQQLHEAGREMVCCLPLHSTVIRTKPIAPRVAPPNYCHFYLYLFRVSVYLELPFPSLQKTPQNAHTRSLHGVPFFHRDTHTDILVWPSGGDGSALPSSPSPASVLFVVALLRFFSLCLVPRSIYLSVVEPYLPLARFAPSLFPASPASVLSFIQLHPAQARNKLNFHSSTPPIKNETPPPTTKRGCCCTPPFLPSELHRTCAMSLLQYSLAMSEKAENKMRNVANHHHDHHFFPSVLLPIPHFPSPQPRWFLAREQSRKREKETERE